MLEVINRCINRRAPGSPACRAGWRRGPWHSVTTGKGRQQRRDPPTPAVLAPGPVVCEAFAWTPELIHIRLVDAAQSGAAVPGCPTSIPFQEWSKESTGSGPLPSFLPHDQLQGINCCSLAGFYRKARVNESLVPLSLSPPQL